MSRSRVFVTGDRETEGCFSFLISLFMKIFGFGDSGLAAEPTKLTRDFFFRIPPRTITEDVLYEIHAPEHPNVEIVFFHGFELVNYRDAYWKGWLSGDRSHCWLGSWLIDDFPKARILTVRYDSSLTHTPREGRQDLHSIAQNLVPPLIEFKDSVGQRNCPVILVGYSVGGLVIKELMVRVSTTLVDAESNSGQVALQSFLSNVRGFFFYATPHNGSRLADSMKSSTSSSLLESLQIFGAQTGRLHDEFMNLRRKYKWRLSGVGEKFETKLGPNFDGIVVEQMSAEHGMDPEAFTLIEADHFTVCKPKKKTDLSFQMLSNFIEDVISQHSQAGHKCEGLPDYLVGRQQSLPNVVRKTLSEGGILGVFGMGGIGKTTFAKSIFHDISCKFEYTCFVEDVKGIPYHALGDTIRGKSHLSGRKVGSRKLEWTELKWKKTLIVMDDVDSDEQLSVLPKLGDLGTGSVKLFTTRDEGLCKRRDIVSFEKLLLEPEDARKLFYLHAFDSLDTPKELEDVAADVNKVIQKCGGLPLSLELIGKHVYACGDCQNAKTWKDILHSLSKAEPVGGDEKDRLFHNVIKVSYDALAKAEQQMFRDVATFFFKERVDVAVAAMSASISERAGSCWGNLVRRSLVQERTATESSWKELWEFEYKRVWMHEHLRDFGKRIAGASFLPADEVIDRINSNEVWVHDETKQLRIVSYSDPSNETELDFSSLAQLKDLKYLSLDGCSHQGGSQDFPQELVLLQWKSNHSDGFPNTLFHCMKNLVVLGFNVEKFSGSATLLEGLGNLVNLMVLDLYSGGFYVERNCRPFQLPENFGGLMKLQRLTLQGHWMLPKSFGQLSSLEILMFRHGSVGRLPDSFGSLHSLNTLVFFDAVTDNLPDSFGSLHRLKMLVFESSPKLTRLPDSFGKLSKLEMLVFSDCEELEVLPPTFGTKLTSLKRLVIAGCPKLQELPPSINCLSGLQNLICPGTPLVKFEGSFENPSMLGHLENLDLEFHNADLPRGFSYLSPTNLQSFKLLLSEQSDADKRVWDLSSLEGLTMQGKELIALCKNLGERVSGDHILLELVREEGSSGSSQHIPSMKEMYICRGQGVKGIPDNIGNLTLLPALLISGADLEELPERITKLSSLKKLMIFSCVKLQTLPESMGQLGSLEALIILSCQKLKSLPESMGQLGVLKQLTIDDCRELKTLPESMGQLGALKKLTIQDCKQLKTLPESMGQLGSLGELSIVECQELTTLPKSMGQLGALKLLSIDECQELKSLPESMGQLGVLKQLRIKYCQKLKTLPESMGQLGSLKKLTIEFCQELKNLPESIGQLGALKQLMICDCPELKTFPESMGQLGALKELTIRKCKELKTLPESMRQLGSLKKLTIEFCQELKDVPVSIEQLAALKHLSIFDCPELKTLPESMGPLGSLRKAIIDRRVP